MLAKMLKERFCDMEREMMGCVLPVKIREKDTIRKESEFDRNKMDNPMDEWDKRIRASCQRDGTS
jgi:hypothetical protein